MGHPVAYTAFITRLSQLEILFMMYFELVDGIEIEDKAWFENSLE